MPRRNRPLPDSLARTPFGVARAIQSGVKPGRLRGSDLERPFHGARDAVVATDVERLAAAYAARMPADHVFSHFTAARLLGLRMPERFVPVSPLDVGVLFPGRAPRATGVRGHELLARTMVTQSSSGLPVTSPVDTWCALASVLSVVDLIVIGDGLVCRNNPVASMEQLVAAVADARNRPGARRLRRALDRIRPRTDSARETLLRLMIVDAGLPEPEVNGEIRDEWGRLVAHGDLLYRREKVLIEYDGGGHRTNEGQFNRDIDRLDDVMELDYRVIRVNKSHMALPAVLIARIRRALLSRGPDANG